MMPLVLVGVCHTTATLQQRERLFVGGDPSRVFPPMLLNCCDVYEVLVVSTCNRFEIYAHASSSASLLGLFQDRLSLSDRELQSALYVRKNSEAVRHLFRVASGLESQILGETQILGQILEGLARGRLQGTVGRLLGPLFESALATGKRVQSETALGLGGYSVGRAAVDKAEQHLGGLRDKSVLIVGAGQTSELIARHIADRGNSPVFVANRTHEHAEELAEKLGGRAVFFSDLEKVLCESDVVISSTRAPHVVIHRDLVERAMIKREGRPLVFIDVAVPRDIDPFVSEIPMVRLFNIDDLQIDAGEREERRRTNIPKAEQIIEEEFVKWETRQAGLNLAPVISSLCKLFESARAEELEKIAGTLSVILPEHRAAIEQMTKAFVSKVLHGPIVRMKEMAALGDDPSAVLCELFSLPVVSSNKGDD